MGRTDCPETSVSKYHYTLRNSQEKSSSKVLPKLLCTNTSSDVRILLQQSRGLYCTNRRRTAHIVKLSQCTVLLLLSLSEVQIFFLAFLSRFFFSNTSDKTFLVRTEHYVSHIRKHIHGSMTHIEYSVYALGDRPG